MQCYLLTGNEISDCVCENPLTIEHLLVKCQLLNDMFLSTGLEGGLVNKLLQEKMISRAINILNIFGFYNKI